jgi:hypothetical protein
MGRNPRMRTLFAASSAVIEGAIRRTAGRIAPKWV